MEDIADNHCAVAANIEFEHEMPRRVTWRRRNVDELVEAVRPGDDRRGRFYHRGNTHSRNVPNFRLALSPDRDRLSLKEVVQFYT